MRTPNGTHINGTPPFCPCVHVIEKENGPEPPMRQISSQFSQRKENRSNRYHGGWSKKIEKLSKAAAALVMLLNSTNNQLNGNYQAQTQVSGSGRDENGNQRNGQYRLLNDRGRWTVGLMREDIIGWTEACVCFN